MDKRSLLVKTEQGNDYLISTAVSQIILLHPILREIIAYELVKGDFSVLLTQAKQQNSPGLLPISQDLFSSLEEVNDYFNYYLFIRENKFLDEFSLYELPDSRYTAANIKNFVAGTSHLSFEVTDKCNLECVYCCYGDLYSGFDDRQGKDMTFDTARMVIDYWLEKRGSKQNISADDHIFFGFYGGEPLLNFLLIEQVVEYVKKKLPPSIRIGFSMTSNGTLLDKYIHFLVDNQFRLMISLDGDFEHNKYRIYKNGDYTFDTICRNVDLIREKYPGLLRQKRGI